MALAAQAGALVFACSPSPQVPDGASRSNVIEYATYATNDMSVYFPRFVRQ